MHITQYQLKSVVVVLPNSNIDQTDVFRNRGAREYEHTVASEEKSKLFFSSI